MSFKIVDFWGDMSGSGIMGYMVALFLVNEAPYSTPYRLYKFTYHHQYKEDSDLSTYSITFTVCRSFNDEYYD